MAKSSVGSGGAWKEILSGTAVGVGGVWKQVQSMHVGVGGVWKEFFRNFTITASPIAWQLSDSQADGDLAAASYDLVSDGTVLTGGGVDVAGSSSWGSPTTVGIGASYWARITPTSGSFDSNSASAWTQLTSGAGCQLANTFGSYSVTFTVEIATDSGGSNIVFTRTGNVMSLTHS